MADSDYPDDILANLVQAATAAADEQTRTPSTLGKRKRGEALTEHAPTLSEDIGDAPDPAAEPITPQFHSSASILFREPSAKSRKHSRPPLGKVFASLELAPENFLRLQTAAKGYMLDESHPERKEVVGQKNNNGDSDLAKLNLWNCVEDFLSIHGYGEKFFGPGAGEGIPGAPPRTLFWPQDSHTIIKLMMPLMRKMVTNERQRIYAATTRRQGSTKGLKDEPTPVELGDSAAAEEKEAEPAFPDQDPAAETSGLGEESASPQLHDVTQPTTTFKQSIVLYVNVVSNTGGALRRVIPRFTLTPEAAPSLSKLLAVVDQKYKPSSRDKDASVREGGPVVKVWLTDGLVTVVEDGEWMVALLSAGVVDWMDGEVRVLVEV